MRVAFFTHYGDWAYGSNRSLVNLIDGLKPYGVEMLVLSPKRGSLTQALNARNVPCLVIPFAPWMSSQPSVRNSFRNLKTNLLSLRPLAHYLKSWRCDVIYTNSSVIPIGALVSSFIKKPHVWHIREFGNLDWGLHHEWGAWTFGFLVGKAKARIAVSQAVRNYVLSDKLAKKTVVIYNGIASEEEFDRLLELSKEPRSSNRPFTFAIIGFIMPSKGQAEAIQAFARIAHISPTRLLVIGNGQNEYVKMCKDLAVSMGVGEKVEFWGYIDDPYKAILEADAVLMCSRNEAMGRVTAEAMAASRPVIGFDQAGTSELIKHGDTGLLYRHGHEELADCMISLLRDPALAQQLGKNGWENARRKFTIESCADQVHAVLKSVYEAQIGHQ